MSILFSGDFHANSRGEIQIITKDALLKTYGREKYDKIKYHIILGDGGFLWQNNYVNDLRNFQILSRRPFPILCVLGNHEPIYGLKDIPQTDIGLGETVYQINKEPVTAYLKRGKVYTIDGIKFLVLGGALSIDKAYRTPNKTWWELEYWTEPEKRELFKLLESENEFDAVISHTGPFNLLRFLFRGNSSFLQKFPDEVSYLNEKVHNRIQFREWLFGHWHRDGWYFDEESLHRYQYLYETTMILDKIDSTLVLYK